MDLSFLKATSRSPIHAHIGKILVLCGLVGLVAGLGAIVFYYFLEIARHLFLDLMAGYHPRGPANEVPLFAESSAPLRRWVLLLLPAVGGLLSGALVYTFAPEAAGHGTDAAIEAYHFRDGAVRARIPIIKAISSAITIGTGGSAGREGPIAQIGAGFGSNLARLLKLDPADRRILMAAGMSAGIGAIFHAPFAGALFAAEVLYSDIDMEHEVIVPAFISSVVSYSVFCTKFGWDPLFATPDFTFNHPRQLMAYFVLALVVSAGAMIYVRFFYLVHHTFRRLKISNFLKPAIGGLIVGVIGFFLPDALGTGYGILQDSFEGKVGIGLLIAVAIGKIGTTAFSVGSGGSGGVFGPAVVIGGALGGAVGLACNSMMPWMHIQPGAFVVVGMAGFFAAAAHCPISTIIMVSEMTGNYHLLLPSMLVCILGFLLARNFSLYEAQLRSRLDSPSKTGNMISAILGKISVAKAIEPHSSREPATIPENMTLPTMIERFVDSEHSCFPVVDTRGDLVGVVDGLQIRRLLRESGANELIVAHDLARKAVTVFPGDTLLTAVMRLSKSPFDELVVVDPHNPAHAVATLDRNSIVRAYDAALFSDVLPDTPAGEEPRLPFKIQTTE